MTYRVYALSTDGVNFRYVGVTSYRNVQLRARQVKAQRFQATTPVSLWAREVCDMGLTITTTLLEDDCGDDDNRAREAWWINHLRTQGHDLVNVLGGGKKNFKRPDSWNRGKKTGPRSAETRQKLADAQRGRPAWNKGIPLSEEQKQKLRTRVVSAETRAKMREARLAYVARQREDERI